MADISEMYSSTIHATSSCLICLISPIPMFISFPRNPVIENTIKKISVQIPNIEIVVSENTVLFFSLTKFTGRVLVKFEMTIVVKSYFSV